VFHAIAHAAISRISDGILPKVQDPVVADGFII
jgi:hypothetical protein